MKISTRRLQETIIRLLKGCLKAWETWLREQPVDEEKLPTSQPSQL